MKFFITSLFFLFVFFGFSQEIETHTVQKGETLYSISKKYKVSVAQLEELNPTAKKGLTVNAILQISEKKVTGQTIEHTVVAKETLFGLSKKYNISIEKIKKLNPSVELEGLKTGMILKISDANKKPITENKELEKPKVVLENSKNDTDKTVINATSQDVFHTVLPKETKYGLSKKYKISIAELEQLNPQIKSELSVGTRLLIRTAEKITKEEIPNEIVTVEEIKPNSVEGLSKIEAVIATATSRIGTKYRSGGTDAAGFDCSGLMFSSFKTIAMELPRSSFEQAEIGVKIDKKLAQKGDLIFFATNGSSRINHVGLITEVTENDIKFVHSSTSSGVIISSVNESYYQKRFIQINRVITE